MKAKIAKRIIGYKDTFMEVVEQSYISDGMKKSLGCLIEDRITILETS